LRLFTNNYSLIAIQVVHQLSPNNLFVNGAGLEPATGVQPRTFLLWV